VENSELAAVGQQARVKIDNELAESFLLAKEKRGLVGDISTWGGVQIPTGPLSSGKRPILPSFSSTDLLPFTSIWFY
jgi:hypothetical protein